MNNDILLLSIGLIFLIFGIFCQLKIKNHKNI